MQENTCSAFFGGGRKPTAASSIISLSFSSSFIPLLVLPQMIQVLKIYNKKKRKKNTKWEKNSRIPTNFRFHTTNHYVTESIKSLFICWRSSRTFCNMLCISWPLLFASSSNRLICFSSFANSNYKLIWTHNQTTSISFLVAMTEMFRILISRA